MAKLRDGVEQHRSLVGKLLFEIVIIFVGVTAAFALEGARQEREDAAYRNGMIAALIPTFNDFERHSRLFQQETGSKIAAFDAALARGEQPKLPIYRESGGGTSAEPGLGRNCRDRCVQGAATGIIL